MKRTASSELLTISLASRFAKLTGRCHGLGFIASDDGGARTSSRRDWILELAAHQRRPARNRYKAYIRELPAGVGTLSDLNRFGSVWPWSNWMAAQMGETNFTSLDMD